MLLITADNQFTAYWNGNPTTIAQSGDWTQPQNMQVSLSPGWNVLAVKVFNLGGPAGLLVDLV